MPTINVNVKTGADDGWEALHANGSYRAASYAATTLVVGIGTTRGFTQTAIRFQTINIPQGSTINAATLTLVTKHTTPKTPQGKIYGDNVDNAGAWGAGNRVNTIAKTAHTTVLSLAATSSNNVTAIVQDIVNRGGWVANNNMAFGIFNTHAAGTTTYKWFGYAYEKGAPDIPNLSVTYSGGGSTAFNDPLWFGMNF